MPASLRVPRPSACIRNTRRYYLGGGWVLARWTGAKRDLLSGDPRPRREEETQTRVKPQRGRSAGAAAQTSPGPRDPFYPSLNTTIPPKPWRAEGTAGRRLQSSVRGQRLCKAPSPPHKPRDFSTPPGSLLCSDPRKPQAKRHLAGCRHHHGHAGEPALPLAPKPGSAAA